MNRDNLTILDILAERARIHQTHEVFEHLRNGEDSSDKLDFGSLDQNVGMFANDLETHCSFGDKVIVFASAGLNFVEIFLSCLKIGAVAVPVHMPRKSTPIDKYESIIKDCAATTAIIAIGDLPLLSENFISLLKERNVSLIVYDRDALTPGSESQSKAGLSDLAFVQYTSGSTGTPKGVCVTHDNIVKNSFMIEAAFRHTPETIMVGWLPTFHDMGLIGNVIQPIFSGFKCISMPPLAFAQKPIRWLKAISKYRATSSGGPNFGYDVLINNTKSEEREGLDLSSWKVAFNGSEPVQSETLSKFTQMYAEYGFEHSTHFPCYGMAETTLFVSGGNLLQTASILSVDQQKFELGEIVQSDAKDAVQPVGCGVPAPEQDIAIVDPDQKRRLAEGEVGEIWISGPNTSAAYLGQAELSNDMMHAKLAGEDSADYLRTGDLGFMQQGELFISGRIKDVMIFGGRNIYPQDVELLIGQSNPCFVHGGTSAFEHAIDGQNKLIVLQEVKRVDRKKVDQEEATFRAKQLISNHFQVALHALVFIHERTLPKTSSGKIQRQLSKKKYLNDELKKLQEMALS